MTRSTESTLQGCHLPPIAIWSAAISHTTSRTSVLFHVPNRAAHPKSSLTVSALVIVRPFRKVASASKFVTHPTLMVSNAKATNAWHAPVALIAAEDNVRGRLKITLWTVALLGTCAVWFWLTFHGHIQPARQETSFTSSDNSVLGGQSTKENFETDRAEMKSRADRERELINSFPPNERADTKWMLQHWGNTDLANRGKGGAR